MGRSHVGAEVFNCSAPDTGNMETWSATARPSSKERWLLPLLDGRDPLGLRDDRARVASSDATNIQCASSATATTTSSTAASGGPRAPDPRCEILIFMGKTDPTARPPRQQSMILVPMDTPGVKVERHLPVFGYDDAPHGHAEVSFRERARAGVQHAARRGPRLRDRPGPPRPGAHPPLHAPDRPAERALELMCRARQARGLRPQAVGPGRDARAHRQRAHPDRPGALPGAARRLDRWTPWATRWRKKEIAMIKVAAPNMACQVIDWAMQVHGGGGVSDDFGLARAYASARTLRFADGPDEVHRNQIAKLELAVPDVTAPEAWGTRAGSPDRAAGTSAAFWPARAPATCGCPRRTCTATSRSRRCAPPPAPASPS
jgi:acyl-CoA dehydrogenase